MDKRTARKIACSICGSYIDQGIETGYVCDTVGEEHAKAIEEQMDHIAQRLFERAGDINAAPPSLAFLKATGKDGQ